VSNNSRKPARWGFDKGLADPKWDWFWRSNPTVFPFWEGAGSSKAVVEPRLATPSASPWIASAAGLAIDMNDDGDKIVLDPVFDFSAWDKFSCFIAIDVDSYEGGNPAFWRTAAGATGNTFFITNGGGGLWVRWGGTDTAKTTTTLGTGQKFFGFSTKSGDTSAFLDGKNIGSSANAYTWPGGSSATISFLGWQTSGAERVDGKYQLIVFAEDHWTDTQHALLAADPFGPFRMIDEVGVVAGVAGAPSGSGTLTFGPIAISGTGDMQADGTGGLVLSRPSIAGTGVAGADGTGALALGPPLIAGTAVEEFIGSGVLALAVPAIAGTGSHSTDAPAGTGALLLGVPSIVGTGIEELIGSGALTLARPNIAGTGVAGADGVGILTIAVIVITGTGLGGVVAALAGLFPRIRRRRRR